MKKVLFLLRCGLPFPGLIISSSTKTVFCSEAIILTRADLPTLKRYNPSGESSSRNEMTSKKKSKKRSCEIKIQREPPLQRVNQLMDAYEKFSEKRKPSILSELQNIAGACDLMSPLRKQIEDWASKEGIVFSALDPFQFED